MTDDQAPRQLSSEPAPRMPGDRPKGAWKKPFAILIGIIGVIASTSTVVALVWNYVEPDTTVQDQSAKLAEIDRKLAAEQEDGQLVNQVSRRVTELSDEYRRIQAGLADIRRLDQSLATAPKTAILTPDQQKLRAAARQKEIRALLTQVDQAEQHARRFIESVEKDQTLDQVQANDSVTARTKTQAIEQARQVRESLLPELKAIRARFGS